VPLEGTHRGLSGANIETMAEETSNPSFDRIALEPAQQELIGELSRIVKSLSVDRREPFGGFRVGNEADGRLHAFLAGLPTLDLRAAVDDLQSLNEEGLIHLARRDEDHWEFSVLAKGHAYARYLAGR